MRNALTCVTVVGLFGSGLAGCDEIVVVKDLPDAPSCTLQISFLDAPGGKTVVEGTLLTFNLTGQGDPRGAYLYAMAAAPSGASLDADDGVFTYTPSFEVSTLATDTSFDVKLTVSVPASSDCPNGAQSTAITVTITVLNDQDQDGQADDGDSDRDGDGLDNGVDAAPDDPDRDDDGDLDGADNCPDDGNGDQADEDGDDIGDVCDDCPADPVNDPDGDGICDKFDNCPDDRNVAEDCDGNNATPLAQCDADEDGLGEVRSAASGTSCDPCPGDKVNDPDDDLACATRDGLPYDNCPTVANPFDCDGGSVVDAQGNLTGEQCDSDGDGLGDACDACPHDDTNDIDGDGVCEDVDNCPGVNNPKVNGAQPDQDDDDQGDACDGDRDGDGVANAGDNCPDTSNADQTNTDGDAQGDACDVDDDDDGVRDDAPDNCPLVENPSQHDFDGDGVGYQCDALETVPFAAHEGTGLVRVAGDAQAGTVAVAFRGANPCTGGGCVKPGVFVVDESDKAYVKRQTAGDASTSWLDLAPPAADLDRPFVAQNGVAWFGATTASGFDLRKVTAGVAAEVFPVAKVFGLSRLYDAPDGKTVIQTRITSAATAAAYFIGETLAAGQPSPVTSGAGETFVDSAGNGPRRFLDQTLYLPTQSTGTYTLLAYRANGGVSVVQVPTGPSTSASVQGATDLRLVAIDPVMGSPWYCWRTTDGSSRIGFFQVHGGTVIHHKKTNWDATCSAMRAERSRAGVWFFIGPGVSTPTNRRVAAWVPDGDNDPLNDNVSALTDVFGTDGVPGIITLHHTAGHTFIERRFGAFPNAANQYHWWNPSAPGVPQPVGAIVYEGVADVEPGSNWLGVVGRNQPSDFSTGVSLVAYRYRGGVSIGAGDSKVLAANVGVGDTATYVAIGPTGTMVSEYANGGSFFVNVVPDTAPVPSAPLTPAILSGTTSVSHHGTTTLLSYQTGVNAGQIGYVSETSTTATFTRLVDGKRHSAFQAGTLKAGVADAFIAYPTNGVTSTFVVARVGLSGAPTLTTVIAGLTSLPEGVELGPDDKLWFAYETDGGYAYASTDGTTLTRFVTDVVDLHVIHAGRVPRAPLWGVVVKNAAGDWYACRIPVTVGSTTVPAGCWQASAQASATPHWEHVDDRGVLHLVTSGGSPAVVTLFRSLGDPDIDPADIP